MELKQEKVKSTPMSINDHLDNIMDVTRQYDVIFSRLYDVNTKIDPRPVSSTESKLSKKEESPISPDIITKLQIITEQLSINRNKISNECLKLENSVGM
jgi:hypothetical protein